MGYKWEHAGDWLNDKIRKLSADLTEQNFAELTRLARDLGSQLDGDQIQDLFQAEMDADGFFDADGDAETEGA